jgi:hypothetical protein
VGETTSLRALARLVFERNRTRDNSQNKGDREPPASEALLRRSGVTQSGEPEDAISGANLVALSTWFERTAPPVDGEPGYEQSRTKRRGRVEHRDGVFLHFCAQCGAWGSYGYGVDVRAGHPRPMVLFGASATSSSKLAAH